MARLRTSWRLAKWWTCAIAVVLMSGFGWVLSQGVQSSSLTNSRSSHVLTPLYAVLVYATLALLFNKRTLTVTNEYFHLTNLPVRVRPTVMISRDRIECVYYFAVRITPEDSDVPVPIDFLTGIATKDGQQIPTMLDHKSLDDAIASAREIARALNEGARAPAIQVRERKEPPSHPAENRLAVIRLSVCLAALIAGVFYWQQAGR